MNQAAPIDCNSHDQSSSAPAPVSTKQQDCKVAAGAADEVGEEKTWLEREHFAGVTASSPARSCDTTSLAKLNKEPFHNLNN